MKNTNKKHVKKIKKQRKNIQKKKTKAKNLFFTSLVPTHSLSKSNCDA